MDDRPIIVCPRCGARDGFHRVTMEDDNSGCLIFLTGGLLASLLYNSSRQDKVVCSECHYVFTPPTRLGKSQLLSVVIIFSILFALLVIAICVFKL